MFISIFKEIDLGLINFNLKENKKALNNFVTFLPTIMDGVSLLLISIIYDNCSYDVNIIDKLIPLFSFLIYLDNDSLFENIKPQIIEQCIILLTILKKLCSCENFRYIIQNKNIVSHLINLNCIQHKNFRKNVIEILLLSLNK